MPAFEVVLLLLVGVAVLEMVAIRIDVPSPLLFVVGGACFAAVPAVREAAFAPDVVFIIFVAPLLYWAALNTSLRDFRRNLRSIFLLAFALVLATTVGVAVVAHAVMPLPWAAAFVLGAIVAPPDAAAAIAIARRLGIPRRLVTVLEGETLMNDTTAFVTYRIAVAAVVTGHFSLAEASGQFAFKALGGVAAGYVMARLIGLIRERLNEPSVENTLSLITPFAVYIGSEALGVSGVLAVVTCGFTLGHLAPKYVSARTRIQSQHLWEMVRFILEGLIFMLIGVELGKVGYRLMERGDQAFWVNALCVTAVVIAIRFMWVFLVTSLVRFAARRSKVRPTYTWKGSMLLASTGMRGGDSLVTALALPLALPDGSPFPGREAITDLTFVVIAVTLLLQGLTLRPIVRRLKFTEDDSVRDEERLARRATTAAGRTSLLELAQKLELPDRVRDQIVAEYELSALRHGAEVEEARFSKVLGDFEQEVLRAERAALLKLRDDQVISDETLRLIQRELDFEELRIGRGSRKASR